MRRDCDARARWRSSSSVGPVGPVQVVEDDQHRHRGRDLRQQPDHGLEQPVALGLRVRPGRSAGGRAGGAAARAAAATARRRARAPRHAARPPTPRTRTGPAPPGTAGTGPASPRGAAGQHQRAAACARLATSASSRVLPTPASPLSSSTRSPRPSPSELASSAPRQPAARAWASSSTRPTSRPGRALAQLGGRAGCPGSRPGSALTAAAPAPVGCSSGWWAAIASGEGAVPSSSRSSVRSRSNTRTPSAMLPWAWSACISST